MKDVIDPKDKYIRLFIKERVESLKRIVEHRKYDKNEWLKQYNYCSSKSGYIRNIDNHCKRLGFNSRNLTEDEKAEVGYWLLIDYVAKLYTQYLDTKSLVNCKYVYKNTSREGEVLLLFNNPMNLNELEDAYSKNKRYLVSKGAGLNHELTICKDKELKESINDDIEINTKALADLKGLYNSLNTNWESKVNPLDPTVDDRKLRNLPLSNEVLKGLVVKSDDNLEVEQVIQKPLLLLE